MPLGWHWIAIELAARSIGRAQPVQRIVFGRLLTKCQIGCTPF